MESLNHANIIKLITHFLYEKNYCIIMELASGGELFSRVISSGRLSEAQARPYFSNLIAAVEYMHANGVVHRDLKLENILLDEYGNCKVCDFGLAHVFAQGEDPHAVKLKEVCGSKSYCAPEVLGGKGYIGFPTDVWSCGIVRATRRARPRCVAAASPATLAAALAVTLAAAPWPSPWPPPCPWPWLSPWLSPSTDQPTGEPLPLPRPHAHSPNARRPVCRSLAPPSNACRQCLFAMLAGFFPLDEASGGDWRFGSVRTAAASGQSTCHTIYGFYERPCTLSAQVVQLIDAMMRIVPEGYGDQKPRPAVGEIVSDPWMQAPGDAASVYRSGGLAMNDPDVIRAMLAEEAERPTAPVYRGMAGDDGAPPSTAPGLARQAAFEREL